MRLPLHFPLHKPPRILCLEPPRRRYIDWKSRKTVRGQDVSVLVGEWVKIPKRLFRLFHLIFRHRARHRGIVAEHLINGQVKRLIVLSEPGVGDGSSALRFERFEVEQARRIQPSRLTLSSEELACDIGRRCNRADLTNGV
jgi:hypothetical protein